MKTTSIQKVILLAGSMLLVFLFYRLATPAHLNTGEPADKTVTVPEFSVAVRLSHKAETQLRSAEETVSISVVFDGDGEPERGEHNAPFRAVYLGSERAEFKEKNLIEFKDKKISAGGWRRLSDKNYFVNINGFSSRKVWQDNILDCDLYVDRIENLKGKTWEMRCSLSGENDGAK